ncbi:MAG: hypothetical protein M1832_004398 [Thelocarpon impressellum]|nr:MAG: hypothetical protein M1832_004398 [Thelocarpon impressellum]
MEDVAQNFEGLEASVVFRDNNAAHEKIGQLQAELVETQKRCGRYKTERGSLRTALASNQASLQEASRRMSELEEVNRKMASANRVLIEQLRTTQNKESGEPELRSGVVLESLDQPVILPQMQPVQREQQAQQIGQALQDGLSYLPELVTAGRLKVPLGLVSPDSQSSSPVPAAPSASIVVDEQHFRAAFGSLFSSVENWARRFANVPDSKSVRDLPADLRGLLREAADASLTESLLAHVETRWTMVTRVVVQYLMNQVQQYDLLKDFEKEVDEKVEACKARLHPRFPTQVRKQILEELAEIANNIKTQQHYAAFIKHKINLTSGQLYTLVGFLQAKNTRTGESRLLFDQIVHEALQLGSEMFASPVEWVIDFPKLGSKYNSHSMINRDPVMNGNPLELERRNIRVKLAITPTVIYRDVAGAALLVSTLHSGHVLLMA